MALVVTRRRGSPQSSLPSSCEPRPRRPRSQPPDRTKVRWGDQQDVAEIPGVEDAGRAAGYIAKYATKTVDGSFGLVQGFRTRDSILRATTTPHLRRFALSAWDLGQREELEDLRLREHAHTLGFAGHLITKSRGYSTTFAALRAARALFAIRDIPDDVEFPKYAYGYLGRGYGLQRASGWRSSGQRSSLRNARNDANNDSRIKGSKRGRLVARNLGRMPDALACLSQVRNSSPNEALMPRVLHAPNKSARIAQCRLLKARPCSRPKTASGLRGRPTATLVNAPQVADAERC